MCPIAWNTQKCKRKSAKAVISKERVAWDNIITIWSFTNMHLFAYAVRAWSCYPFFLLIYLWIYLYLPTYLHLPTSILHLPTSPYIYRHLPTSTYIYSPSTYIYLHLPTPAYIYLHIPTNLHLPTSTDIYLLIYIYLHLPTSTDIYRHLPTTYIYLHLPTSLPTSTYIYLHLPTSTYIYLHLPTSTYIYLHLPTSAYICLHLPTSTYIYLHLPTSTYSRVSQGFVSWVGGWHCEHRIYTSTEFQVLAAKDGISLRELPSMEMLPWKYSWSPWIVQQRRVHPSWVFKSSQLQRVALRISAPAIFAA